MTGKAAAPIVLLAVVLGLSGCVTKENYNAQILRTNNFQRLLAEEEKRSVELSTEIAKLKDEKLNLEAKNKSLNAQLTLATSQVVRSLEEVGRLQDEIKQARGGFSFAPSARGPSQEPLDRLLELQEKPAVPSEKKDDKKKGKATAQAKAQKPSEAPVPPPKAEPPAPTPPLVPLLREPSQEPPDRLNELQAAPVSKPEKKVEPRKVEPKKGKATAKVTMQKPGEEAPPAPKVQAKAEAEADSEDASFRYHKVKNGETLAGIAKLYKTDAKTLRELNDMGNGATVRPGERLIVGQKQ